MGLRHILFCLLVLRKVEFIFGSKKQCDYGVLQNVDLEGGFRSHSHAMIKGVKNMCQCIKKCSSRDDCDLAMYKNKKCYSVSCKGDNTCQISHSKTQSKLTAQIAFITNKKKSKKRLEKQHAHKKQKHRHKKEEMIETDRDEEESRDLENVETQSEFADIDVADTKGTFSQNKTTLDMERTNVAENVLDRESYLLENTTKSTPSNGLQQTYLPSRAVSLYRLQQQSNDSNTSVTLNPHQNFAAYGYYSNYNINNQSRNSQLKDNMTNYFNLSGSISNAYQYAINNATPTGLPNKHLKFKSTSKLAPTQDSFVTEITGEIEENSGDEENIGQSTGVGVSEDGAIAAKEESPNNQQASNNSNWYQNYQYQYANGYNQNYTYYGQYNANRYPTQNSDTTQIQGELDNSNNESSESGDDESGDNDPTKKPTRNLYVDEIQKELSSRKKNKHSKLFAKKQITREENPKKKSSRSKKRKSKKTKNIDKSSKNELLLFVSTKPTTSPVTQIKKEFENVDSTAIPGMNDSSYQLQQQQQLQQQLQAANTTGNQTSFQSYNENTTTDVYNQFKIIEENKTAGSPDNISSLNTTDYRNTDTPPNPQLLTASQVNKPLPVPVFFNITSGAQYIPLQSIQQQQQFQQQQQQQQQPQAQMSQQDNQTDDKVKETQKQYENLVQEQKQQASVPTGNETTASNITNDENPNQSPSTAAANQQNNIEINNVVSQAIFDLKGDTPESIKKKKQRRKRKKYAYKKLTEKIFFNSSDSSRFFDQDNMDSAQEEDANKVKTVTEKPNNETMASTEPKAQITYGSQQIPSPLPDSNPTTLPSLVPTPAPNLVAVFPTAYMLPLDPNWQNVYQNQSLAYYQMLNQNTSTAQAQDNATADQNSDNNKNINSADNVTTSEKFQNAISSGLEEIESASGSGEGQSASGPEQLSDRKSLSSDGTNYKRVSEKNFVRTGSSSHQGFIPIAIKSKKLIHSRTRHIRPIKAHGTLINTGIKANTLLGKMLTQHTDERDDSLRPLSIQMAPPVVSPMVVLAQPQNILTPPSQFNTPSDSLGDPLSLPVNQKLPDGDGVFVGQANPNELTNQVLNSVDGKQEILNALSRGPLLNPPNGESSNSMIGDGGRQVLDLNNAQNQQQLPQIFDKSQSGLLFNQVVASRKISGMTKGSQMIPSIDENTLRQFGIINPKLLKPQVSNQYDNQGEQQFANSAFSPRLADEKKSHIEGNAVAGSIIIAQPHDIGKKGKIEKPHASKRKLSNEKSLNRANFLTKFHPAAAIGMRRNESSESHEHSKALLESLILNTHDPARVDNITPDPLEEQDPIDMRSETGNFITSDTKHGYKNKVLDEGQNYGINYANSLLLKRNISRSHVDNNINDNDVKSGETKNTSTRNTTAKNKLENARILGKTTNITKTKNIQKYKLEKTDAEKYANLHLPKLGDNTLALQNKTENHKNQTKALFGKGSGVTYINKTKHWKEENAKTKSPIVNAFKEMLIKELHTDNAKYEASDVYNHKLSKNFIARIDEKPIKYSQKNSRKPSLFPNYEKHQQIKSKSNNKYRKRKRKRTKHSKRKRKGKKLRYKNKHQTHAKNSNNKFIVHKAYQVMTSHKDITSHSNIQDILHGHPMDGHRFGDSDYQSTHKWANHDFSPQPGHYGMHNDTADNHENTDRFADIYNQGTVKNNNTESKPNNTVIEEKQQNYKINHTDGSIETGTHLSRSASSHFESNTYDPLLHEKKPINFGIISPNLNNILQNLPSMIPSQQYPYYPIYFGKQFRKIGRHESISREHSGRGLLLKSEKPIGNRGMFSNMHAKERHLHGPLIHYLDNALNNFTSLDSKRLIDRNRLRVKSQFQSKSPIGFIEAFKAGKKLNLKREQAITDRFGVFNRLANTLKRNLEAIHKARKQQPPRQAWNTFLSSQKRLDQLTEARQKVIENHGNCQRGLTVRGATLRGGILSGEFHSMGVVSTQKACTALCCSNKRCDIAMTIGRECINIKCFNKKACTIAPAGHLAVYRNILPVVTFVKRVTNENIHNVKNSDTSHQMKNGFGKRSIGFPGLENDDQLENADPMDVAAVKALITNPKYVSCKPPFF